MSKSHGHGRLTPAFAALLNASSAITFPILSQHMLRPSRSKNYYKSGRRNWSYCGPSKAGRTHDFAGMRRIAEKNGW